MASNIINRLNIAVQKFERALELIFFHKFPPRPEMLAVAINDSVLTNPNRESNTFSLKEMLEASILWAVPKKRRTVEKRWNRRFGYPEYHWKPLVPKPDILMCNNCGHDYESGYLCGYCLKKVQTETKEMQEKIVSKLGLQPVEQDVVVLYEGESKEQVEKKLQKQRIIEMPKKRPAWFHQNLMQSSTQQSCADDKDVKPQDFS